MNYTKPNDENHIDNPEDWLFASLTFGFALGHLIPQGYGIIISLKGDTLKINPGIERVIVYNDDEMMRIIEANERTDLEDGDMVKMISEDDIKN